MNRLPTNYQSAKNSRQSRLLRIWIGLLIIGGIGISGCSLFRNDSDISNTDILKNVFTKAKERNSAAKHSSGASNKVKLAGGLTLGDTDNLAFTSASLADVMDDLIETEKWNSIRSLISLYPDIVSNILYNGGESLTGSRVELTAKLVDEQWSGNGKDLWQDFAKSLAQDPSRDFLQNRLQFLKLLENNQIDEAFALQISRKLPQNGSQITYAEALRLEGIAYLMAGKHQKSANLLAEAKQILEQSHPYQASQVGLLLGEAQRHAGEFEAWKVSWESSIKIQSRWLAERGLSDPTFWKKAAFLRPVSTPWPSTVIRRLQHSLRNENLEFGSDQESTGESVVWAFVGTQSLKRHESQNAILAFKKAEALVDSSALKEELQMQQALAMIDGGQQGPASAILLRLGSKPTLLGDRAKAILATLKLQNGSLAQGMNLLQSSIKTSNQWPTSERLRAQADYGLAYLMRGREEQGIALLNQVHKEFVKEKHFDHAAQCLANIATYYSKTDQTKKHRLALARIKELEVF